MIISMFIERPPLFYRIFYPGAVWRIKNGKEKTVYLTFDDGPIPEVTPWVLDVLDTYRIKATFFCVGDNVRKHPSLYRQILKKGHITGNHTFNHIQGWKHGTDYFIANTQKANSYIQSPFFRPPHGHILHSQFVLLKKKGYKTWDYTDKDSIDDADIYVLCVCPSTPNDSALVKGTFKGIHQGKFTYIQTDLESCPDAQEKMK